MSRRLSRMRWGLVVGWMIASSARFAYAQMEAPPAARPTVILFVGNSFTFGGATVVRGYNSRDVTDENSHGTPLTGGIPGIFKKFTDEAGLRYEVHVETVGGKTLEYHYQHSLSLIKQDKWDDVVLQGSSTESIPAARGGASENFVRYATLLEKTIHAAKPGAKVYLYETWAYPLKAYTDKAPDHAAALTAMTNDLHVGYETAFVTDGRFEAVAPVGIAWMKLVLSGAATDDPEHGVKPGQINLWDKDNKHPSVQGSYLTALVLFEQITGSDPRKLGSAELAARDLGIAGDDAVKLQVFAAEMFMVK